MLNRKVAFYLLLLVQLRADGASIPADQSTPTKVGQLLVSDAGIDVKGLKDGGMPVGMVVLLSGLLVSVCVLVMILMYLTKVMIQGRKNGKHQESMEIDIEKCTEAMEDDIIKCKCRKECTAFRIAGDPKKPLCTSTPREGLKGIKPSKKIRECEYFVELMESGVDSTEDLPRAPYIWGQMYFDVSFELPPNYDEPPPPVDYGPLDYGSNFN